MMNCNHNSWIVLSTVAIVFVALVGCVSGPGPRPTDGEFRSGTLTVNGTDYVDIEGFITVETTRVQHWYRRTGPKSGPIVVLINGSDTTSLVWDDSFVASLLAAGFHIVRYDPRDVGRSERLAWPKGFKAQSWTPDQPPPYPLTAMMDDLVGLLNALSIERSHLAGISMGGMIAQLMSVEHPDRVASLTLLSTSPSSSFDSDVDPLDQEQLQYIGSLMEKAGMDQAFSFLYGERWIKKLTEAMQVVTGASDGGLDTEALIRETEPLGGYNFMSGHGFAIASAPSRVADLPRITAPTLILHGTGDPWFRFSHAERLSELIGNSVLIPIEGEGHAAPRDMYNPYVTVVADHIKDAASGER